MRIKFEKGMTPERIAQAFVDYIRQNDIVIGAVNMYIQTYNNEMKPEKFNQAEEGWFVCSPSEIAQEEYQRDLVMARRKKMKAVI